MITKLNIPFYSLPCQQYNPTSLAYWVTRSKKTALAMYLPILKAYDKEQYGARAFRKLLVRILYWFSPFAHECCNSVLFFFLKGHTPSKVKVA